MGGAQAIADPLDELRARRDAKSVNALPGAAFQDD
jgi:hypothetical protein